MMQNDPVNGPNEVKSLISGLGFTAAYFIQFSSKYDEWKNDENNRGGHSFRKFSEDFKGLGQNISLLSLYFGYWGAHAQLNSEAVSLADLATVQLPFFDGFSNTNTTAQVMCTLTNSIFRPEALLAMSQTPPVRVVQPYYSCSPTMNSAFLTAAGLAAANSSMISALFLGLSIFVLVQYMNNVHKKGKITPPARKFLAMERAIETLQAEVNSLRSEVLELRGGRSASAAPSLLAGEQYEENPMHRSSLSSTSRMSRSSSMTQRPSLGAPQLPPDVLPSSPASNRLSLGGLSSEDIAHNAEALLLQQEKLQKVARRLSAQAIPPDTSAP